VRGDVGSEKHPKKFDVFIMEKCCFQIFSAPYKKTLLVFRANINE
jgi:hypothetical protein